jgi:hypothetical protein
MTTAVYKVSQRSGNSRYRLSLDTSPIPTPTPTPALGRFLSVRGGLPRVGRIDPNSGNFSPLPNSSFNFSDIAAFGNDLYGTTLFGSFYRIDPNTGTETFLGTASAFELNALDFAPSGVLYGTATSVFYTINTSNGSSQKIAHGIRTTSPTETTQSFQLEQNDATFITIDFQNGRVSQVNYSPD